MNSRRAIDILTELEKRGLVKDNKDAVYHGLLALYDRVLKRDLIRLRPGSGSGETMLGSLETEKRDKFPRGAADRR